MKIRLLIPLLLAACATPGTGSPESTRRDLISTTEIEAATAANVYDLVRSARPDWLRKRGVRTMGELAGEETLIVYMDNARLGPPEAMRSVPLGSIRFLRFFTAAEATQRFGAGHLQGAILISTQDP